MVRQRAICVLAAAIAMVVPASILFSAPAERVGYQFKGSIQPSFGSTVTLFGVNLQLPASISGTFSYDLLSQAGTPNSAGAVPYKQSIEAGFTLETDDERLRLSADHFKVQVANDYHRTMPVETVDIVDVIFDNTDPLTPGPMNVNGQAWPGTAHNFIVLELSYPPETFSDTSLPKVLPNSFSMGLNSIVGSGSALPQLFEITKLEPISLVAGDYNLDGALGRNDFDEWRRVYGDPLGAVGYGDGNGDGIVDSGDYVILRHAMAVAGNGNGLAISAVPEPHSLILALCASFGMLIRRRMGSR
jgi:hypothetical protein